MSSLQLYTAVQNDLIKFRKVPVLKIIDVTGSRTGN
jgi:hypothetical protein